MLLKFNPFATSLHHDNIFRHYAVKVKNLQVKGIAARTIIAATIITQSIGASAQMHSDFEAGLRRSIDIKGSPSQRFNLADRMAYYNVPGVSVAIMEGCQIVFAKGFGITELNGKSITPETLFQAASISKPVSAVAALRLVEQGKLALDTDVRSTLKGWKLPDSPLSNSHPVTLRGLLSHGAGLGVSGFEGYAAGTEVPTILQVLDGVAPANSEPVTVEITPGSRWEYSGGGYTIAQLMMIEATGRSFPSLMEKEVLGTAGMISSSFEQPLSQTKESMAATGHRSDGSAIVGKWHTYPEMAAAGLWTTPSDLLLFAKAIINADRGEAGAILGQEITREMLSPQMADWGLGPIVNLAGKPREFGHSGANEGFRARLRAFPDTCQGAVVMTNSDNGSPLAEEIMRAIADAYHWPNPMKSDERDVVELTPTISEQFIGNYHLKDSPGTRINITHADNKTLVLSGMEREAGVMFPSSDELIFSPDDGLQLKFNPDSGNYTITEYDETYEVVREAK